jgi:2-polyprenyl-6-methoxyphenol hydroxylase-like FAD-dependent oxidoreductase
VADDRPGLHRLEPYASVGGGAAIRLHERRGSEIEGGERGDVLLAGEPVDTHVMEGPRPGSTCGRRAEALHRVVPSATTTIRTAAMNENAAPPSPDRRAGAPLKAVVIGGSLGGLFAGAMLRRAGWEVDVFERSPDDMSSDGGGVVLQPDVREVLDRAGAGDVDLGVRSRHRVGYRSDGTVEERREAPQTQTSWSSIFRAARDAYDGGYHTGMKMVDAERDDGAGTATAIFEDGTRATGALLVGADGNGSTLRARMWAGAEPSYAGYFAWRGLVPERDMPHAARELAGEFAFAHDEGSHMLGYLVPGPDGDASDGNRLYNYVWYRIADPQTLERIMTDRDGTPRHTSIPPGELADEWVRTMREDASRLLPPPFEAVVHATKQPFAQAIRDLGVETMVKGRAILMGDAAFVPRPHTAAGTSKAAADAIALGERLGGPPDDIDGALAAWNRSQLRLGNQLGEQGTRTGDHLMFGAPARGARVG